MEVLLTAPDGSKELIMSLDQAVKKGWNHVKGANSRISAFPTFLVEGVIAQYDKIHDAYLRHKLAKVNGNVTDPNLIAPLIDNLRGYTQTEVAEAIHRVELNEALLSGDETQELHQPDLPNRPENITANWTSLGQELAQLSQYSRILRFDSKTKQFYLTRDAEPDVGNSVRRINEQLRHANDLSIIVDPKYRDYAIADRSDFGARKLVKALMGEYGDDFRRIIQSGFVVVGPRNIAFYTPPDSQGKLPLFVESFVNPTLEQLVLRQRNAIEEELEVAKAGDVAKGTLEGNILGWIDVARYVVVPYIPLRAGLLALQNNLGIDNVAVDYTLNSVGQLMDSGLLLGSFFFPSKGEVTGIASHANYEKIARQIAAYNVGREGVEIDGVRYRDMTLYRNISASFTQEENMQVQGMFGWELATVFTGVTAVTGLITYPIILMAASSAQVSNNNYWTNLINFKDKHFEPLRRQRRRKYVAERPELIQYWGIERIVDPRSKNPEEDLRSINPRILDYLVSNNSNEVQQLPDVTMKVRRRIEDKVNQRVTQELRYFDSLPEERRAQRILWQYLRHRNKRILHFFSDNKSKSRDRNVVKVEKPKGYCRGLIFSDLPGALGSPFSLPGYSEWRVPEGSYFNRSFNWANWVVPLTFAAGYYLLGQTEISPGEIRAVQINDYIDILSKAGIALIAAGTIAAGAADTAGACISSRVEVLFEQARKGKEYLLGSHAKTVKNAIEGKNEAIVYQIPHNNTEAHYYKIIDLLLPLSKKSKIPTKILTDSEDSFNAQLTLNPNIFGKGNYITTIRKSGEESIIMYASKDLGQTFQQYKVNTAM